MVRCESNGREQRFLYVELNYPAWAALQEPGAGQSLWRHPQCVGACLATTECPEKCFITFLAISRSFLKKSSEAWLSPPSDCIGSTMIPATIFFFFLYFTIRSSTCKSNIYGTSSFQNICTFPPSKTKSQQNFNFAETFLAIKVPGGTKD